MSNIISNEWLILQLLFPLLVILVNITLFHYLHGRRRDSVVFSPPSLLLEDHLKKLGISLSFSHVLSGACLFVTAILSMLIHHFVGYYSFVERVETFVLCMANISTMFHVVVFMINDFKRVSCMDVLPEENSFYVLAMWISTALCTLLLFFVQSEHEITHILTIVILVTDVGLFTCYIEIIRRVIIEKYREQNRLTELDRVSSGTHPNQHYLCLLYTSPSPRDS